MKLVLQLKIIRFRLELEMNPKDTDAPITGCLDRWTGVTLNKHHQFIARHKKVIFMSKTRACSVLRVSWVIRGGEQ